MRICLINPPRIHPKSWGKPTVYQPWDIAYIAAVLENQHKVCIIDAPTEGRDNLEKIDDSKYRVGLSNKAIEERISRWAPDVVGVNIPFSGWSKAAFQVSYIAKKVDTNIITVLHGLHPSAMPMLSLNQPNVDFVVMGEPEYTMLELADALEQGISQDLKKIKGIGFIKNQEKIINPPRPMIQDLDSLPFPARHLLPMNIYFDAAKEEPLRGEISKRWASMITSRGCPHTCVFCFHHNVMGRKWRGRSPENVLCEIEHLVETYKIRQIDFNDNNMTLDKKRMETICDLIVERGLDIEWYTPDGLRADALDESLLTKMSASGCKKIRLAPESGVQHVVDQIAKKKQSLTEVEKAVILAKKVGIKVGIFFVIGLIGETKDDIKESINYAYKLRRLGADIFHFSIAMPQYGTELYEQAKSRNLLNENFNDEALAGTEPLIETPDFTADDLRELCEQANLVNSSFSSHKIIRALRDPKKALKFLLKK